MAETKAPDQTKCALSVRASLAVDGSVSGRVAGTMYSHRKKADKSETFVSVGVELDAADRKKVKTLFAELAKKHRVRVEARAFDERSAARRHARLKREIVEEEA